MNYKGVATRNPYWVNVNSLGLFFLECDYRL